MGGNFLAQFITYDYIVWRWFWSLKRANAKGNDKNLLKDIHTQKSYITLLNFMQTIVWHVYIVSDHDFHNITLASPATDYKDERMNE